VRYHQPKKEQALPVAWDAISLFLHNLRDLILYKSRFRFNVRQDVSLALYWSDVNIYDDGPRAYQTEAS